MIDIKSPREIVHDLFVDTTTEWDEPAVSNEIADVLIDKLLALYPSFAGVLDGTHVVVPKEPTDGMIAAGWIDKEDVSPTDIYVAMIEAAQDCVP